MTDLPAEDAESKKRTTSTGSPLTGSRDTPPVVDALRLTTPEVEPEVVIRGVDEMGSSFDAIEAALDASVTPDHVADHKPGTYSAGPHGS